MKRKVSLSFIVLVLLLGAQVYAQDSRETAKIQYLIASVETMQGATFIRNGLEYDTRQASAHLRLKLKRAGDRVRTAEDFITLCASKSFMTGEPYQIRLADGTTVKAEAFFRKKLIAFAKGRP